MRRAAFITIALVYLLYAWDRVVVPVTLLEVVAAHHLTTAEGAFLASIFTLGLAMAALPASVAIARLGTRASLATGAACFSVFTLYIPFGIGLPDLLASRVAAGMGEALYSVALYSLLASNAGKRKGTAAGVATTLFGLGTLTGAPIIGQMQAISADWRVPYLALGGLGVAGAVALRILLPAEAGRATMPRFAQPTLARLLRDTGNQVVLIVTAINGIGVYAFISIYITYLRTVWHMPQSTAGYVFSAYGLGGLLGGLAMGALADRVGRRRFLAVTLPLAGGAGLAAFLAAPNLPLSVAATFALGMLLNGIYSNCYAALQERVPAGDLTLATGVLAGVYFLTASFSGWLIVWLAQRLGWGIAAACLYPFAYCTCAVLVVAGLRRPPPLAETLPR